MKGIFSSENEGVIKPIALSFFSGLLGFDLGIEKAGFDIRLVSEIDRHCRESIFANRPDVQLIGDIMSYDADQIRQLIGITHADDIDLIFGGPPCQAFSTAGRRKGFEDKRGNVFLKYVSLALALRPKYFIIENVRGLLSCAIGHRSEDMYGDDYPDQAHDAVKGSALHFVIHTIQKAGYAYSFDLYNAANFGTPQMRDRVVILCSRDGIKPPYLMPTHDAQGRFGLKPWATLRGAVQDLESHTYLPFPERRLRYYRLLKPGQNWRSLPDHLQQEAMGNAYFSGGGRTGFYRRLDWDAPAPTLLTHPAMPATDLGHPVEDRPLSVEEYKRIQQFPDDWIIAGNLRQQYKQIGNAVPFSLGYAAGRLVAQLIKGDSFEEELVGFNHSRYCKTRDDEWLKEFKSRCN